MNRILLSIGVVILVLGLILVVAFWPLTSVRGRDLTTDGYEVGDKVTIYGTITRIIPLGDLELIQIDGELEIVKTDGRTSMQEGDVIYGELRYSQTLIRHWRIEGDLKPKMHVDLIFYAITGVGLAISAAGAVKV